MTLPTLHGNGTSAQSLAASAEAAWDAIEAAYQLVKQTGPNPRDYGPGDLEKASAEHASRLQRLADVQHELGQIMGHCDRAK